MNLMWFFLVSWKKERCWGLKFKGCIEYSWKRWKMVGQCSKIREENSQVLSCSWSLNFEGMPSTVQKISWLHFVDFSYGVLQMDLVLCDFFSWREIFIVFSFIGLEVWPNYTGLHCLVSNMHVMETRVYSFIYF